MPVRNTEILLLKERIGRALAEGRIRPISKEEAETRKRRHSREMDSSASSFGFEGPSLPSVLDRPWSESSAPPTVMDIHTCTPPPASSITTGIVPPRVVTSSGAASPEAAVLQIMTFASQLTTAEMITRQWPILKVTNQHADGVTKFYLKELIKAELCVHPATIQEEVIETWRQREILVGHYNGQQTLEGIIPNTEMYMQHTWPSTHAGSALVSLQVVEAILHPNCIPSKLRTILEVMIEHTEFGELTKVCNGIPVPVMRATWSEQTVVHRGQTRDEAMDTLVSRGMVGPPYIEIGARTPIYSPIYMYESNNMRASVFKDPVDEKFRGQSGVVLPSKDKWYRIEENNVVKEMIPTPMTVTSPFYPTPSMARTPNPYAETQHYSPPPKFDLQRHISDTSPAHDSLKRHRRERTQERIPEE